MYNGQIENDACENWCLNVLRWIELQEQIKRQGELLPEQLKIQMVGSYLGGPAQTWWTREEKRRRDGEHGALMTLDDCLAGLRLLFAPADNNEIRQRRFETLV